MKRTTFLFLLVLLILATTFILLACNDTTKECEHQWRNPTCLSPKTCGLCHATEGNELGHNFSQKIPSYKYLCSKATSSSPALYYYSCIRCGEASSKTFEYGNCVQIEWVYDYYVDYQFGEPTNEWYVTTEDYINGTFENSATEDSSLFVEILYDCNDEISIFLYEYADTDNLVKNNSSEYKDYYKIVIKNENNKTIEARGQMHPGGDRIYIIETYHKDVLNLMQTSKKLKFFIQCEDTPTSQYRFDLDMSDFNLTVSYVKSLSK